MWNSLPFFFTRNWIAQLFYGLVLWISPFISCVKLWERNPHARTIYGMSWIKDMKPEFLQFSAYMYIHQPIQIKSTVFLHLENFKLIHYHTKRNYINIFCTSFNFIFYDEQRHGEEDLQDGGVLRRDLGEPSQSRREPRYTISVF